MWPIKEEKYGNNEKNKNKCENITAESDINGELIKSKLKWREVCTGKDKCKCKILLYSIVEVNCEGEMRRSII